MSKPSGTTILAVGLVLVVGGYLGFKAFGAWPAESDVTSPTPDPSSPISTETAKVRRGNLVSEHEFSGTVTFGTEWVLNSSALGTITFHREPGDIVNPGEVIVKVNERPLYLALGDTPMYRDLYRVNTSRRDKLLNGPDISQLQAFLLAGGFDDNGRLEDNGIFDRPTERAVKDWQKAAGLDDTGQVDNSELIFHPGPVRISSSAKVGTRFEAVAVTEAQVKVSLDVSNRDRALLEKDTTVMIELPDESRVEGTIVEQEQVIRPDGSSIWRTLIEPSAPIPQGVATLSIFSTELVAQDVLLVPVSALLALAEGGFAVELDNSRLVPVTVGEVLDAMAEITGELSEGDTVVVAL